MPVFKTSVHMIVTQITESLGVVSCVLVAYEALRGIFFFFFKLSLKRAADGQFYFTEQLHSLSLKFLNPKNGKCSSQRLHSSNSMVPY